MFNFHFTFISYDLSTANDFLYSIGMGLHHSGVEILGREYSFASGGGIFDSSPKEAPGAKFRESIELGSFDGGSSELNSAISGKFGSWKTITCTRLIGLYLHQARGWSLTTLTIVHCTNMGYFPINF